MLTNKLFDNVWPVASFQSPLLPLALLLFCKWVLLIMKELMLQKVIFLKDICINNTYQAKKWIQNFLLQNNLTPPLRDHCLISHINNGITLTIGSQAALLNHLSCMTRPNHTHKGFNMFACLLMWKRLLYAGPRSWPIYQILLLL